MRQGTTQSTIITRRAYKTKQMESLFPAFAIYAVVFILLDVLMTSVLLDHFHVVISTVVHTVCILALSLLTLQDRL